MNILFRPWAAAERAPLSPRRRRFSHHPLREPVSLQVQALEPRLALATAAELGSKVEAAVPDTAGPQVGLVRLLAPATPRISTAGQTLAFEVGFTDSVVVTGAPTLPILIGESVRQAAWNGKDNGSTALVFTTVVQPGDFAPARGVQVAGPISMPNGATIQDRAGNAINPAASGTFVTVRVDAVGPSVTEFGTVAVTSRLVSLRVKFDEAVRVTGKPSIPFTLAGAQKNLVYAGGSGKNVLTFQYRASRREAPTAGNVAIATQAISLGRGRITDRAGNVATSLAPPTAPLPAAWMQFVTVRDVGNASDFFFGHVDHVYRIGKFEVTIGQYAEFLNAVARSDPYGLYNENMETNLNIAGIARSGTPGAYTYTVMDNGGDSSKRPITYVSWFDAARFANWMHNGRPTGSPGPTTTEDGAYTLNGATKGAVPAKNAGARFSLPTEDEWFKAAYYKGGSLVAGYWDYATQSHTLPGNSIGGGSNQANYYADSGFSVTQSVGDYLDGQNYLTDVGAFSGGASAYGAFDMTGNVEEWNDLKGVPDASRGLRGGHWLNTKIGLSAAFSTKATATIENNVFGFRLASSV